MPALAQPTNPLHDPRTAALCRCPAELTGQLLAAAATRRVLGAAVSRGRTDLQPDLDQAQETVDLLTDALAAKVGSVDALRLAQAASRTVAV